MKLKKKFAASLVCALVLTGVFAGTSNEALAYYSIKNGELRGESVGPFRSMEAVQEAAEAALAKNPKMDTYEITYFLDNFYFNLIGDASNFEEPL